MFSFLKKKLKSWISKSKEKLEEKEKTEEKKVIEKAKKEIKEKKPAKQKKEKTKKEKPILKPKEVEQSNEILEKTSLIEKDKVELTTEKIEEKAEKKSFFSKLKSKFSYKIDEEEFEEIFNNLEEILLENNTALETIDNIKKNLKEKLIGKEIKKQDLEKEIKESLKEAIKDILIEPFDLIGKIKQKENKQEPFVILFVGINGSGKTTNIAKLSYLLQKNKISTVFAAADTFRAASIEQLSKHAEKLKTDIIKQHYGADPTAVAFDAIKHAKARNIKAVLIDTAGRMHTKENLIREMEKIVRICKPDLKIFVAESITGNDAIEQAKIFNEAINIDAIILSKSDIDKKGGAALSISNITGKPIIFLGTGQEYKDLIPFNKEKFVEQLGL